MTTSESKRGGSRQAESGEGKAPKRNARKQRVGVVTSDKARKTVTVTVERKKSHALYGKQYRWTKRYHAHDEKDECRVGDVVRIQETRPLSKTKRWRVVELIERPQ
jgi:small subunit ribosomal protein S17